MGFLEKLSSIYLLYKEDFSLKILNVRILNIIMAV